MSFSVLLFAADTEALREKLANGPSLLPEVAARASRNDLEPEEIEEFCAHVSAVRSLDWPRSADMLSVYVFMWTLDDCFAHRSMPAHRAARKLEGSPESLGEACTFLRRRSSAHGTLPPCAKPSSGKGEEDVGSEMASRSAPFNVTTGVAAAFFRRRLGGMRTISQSVDSFCVQVCPTSLAGAISRAEDFS